METTILLFLILLLVVVGIIMISQKLKVAYPVLLVITGLLISFIPGLPKVELDPDLVFILFLPPILYEAAWSCSFKELYKWRRIILSFAFIVVFITAIAVALVSYWFIPGFTLALGFLLGGIVSPPDAVSANAITKFVKIPKRFSTILEGESLLNDASSLIILQFAVLAVATGTFDATSAGLKFFWMIAGGVGAGILVGWLFSKIHKILPTDANIDVILTLITPYLMYIFAEEIQGSGVLSVISGGLLLSRKRYDFLQSSSRVRSINVWESLIFLLNGIIFILIGLDLHQITSALGKTEILEAISYGILITFVVITIRLVSSFGAVWVTLLMRNFIKVADSNPPGKKVPIIMGWSGMRGVVSLAAALSIPVYLENGEYFPKRDLILFITFIVILLTLIIQGLTLPLMIKRAGLKEEDYTIPEDEVMKYLDQELHQLAMKHIENKYVDAQASENYQKIFGFIQDQIRGEKDLIIKTKSVDTYKELLALQRNFLIDLNEKREDLNEEIIRKKIMILDYQEERLNLNG